MSHRLANTGFFPLTQEQDDFDVISEQYFDLKERAQAALAKFPAFMFDTSFADMQRQRELLETRLSSELVKKLDNMFYLLCQRIHVYKRQRKWKQLTSFTEKALKTASMLGFSHEQLTIFPYQIYGYKSCGDHANVMNTYREWLAYYLENDEGYSLSISVVHNLVQRTCVYGLKHGLYDRLIGVMYWVLGEACHGCILIDAHAFLAAAYFYQGSHETAIDHLRELVAMDFQYRETWFWLCCYVHILHDLCRYQDTISISSFQSFQQMSALQACNAKATQLIWDLNNDRKPEWPEIKVDDPQMPKCVQQFLKDLEKKVKAELERLRENMMYAK